MSVGRLGRLSQRCDILAPAQIANNRELALCSGDRRKVDISRIFGKYSSHSRTTAADAI
ncbi:unnamed protein product, partial [Gongylonema pulchrum]